MKKLSAGVFALVLAACGGGSDTSSDAGTETTAGAAGTSSGSTGNGSSVSTSPPVNSTTYSGAINVTLKAPGFADRNETAPVSIVISGSNVRLTSEGRTVNTTLNGNSFTADIPINETDDGITCSGIATIKASVNGSTISGPVTGSGTCKLGLQDIPVTITGNLNATS